MSEIIIREKESARSVSEAAPAKKSFKGYTMEELRYQKALAALRKEFCKSNMTQSIANLKKPVSTGGAGRALPFLNKAREYAPAVANGGSVAKVVARSLLGRLKPIDYIMLGISLIGPARKAVRMFRRKKDKRDR